MTSKSKSPFASQARAKNNSLDSKNDAHFPGNTELTRAQRFLSSPQAAILQMQKQYGNSQVLKQLFERGGTKLTRQNQQHIQRFEVDLSGWSGGPDDDSYWEITPTVSLWYKKADGTVSARSSGFSDPNAKQYTLHMPLDAKGVITLGAWVHAMQDNSFLSGGNKHNKWYLSAQWDIQVDKKGNMSIEIPRPAFDTHERAIQWSLQANVVPDDKTSHDKVKTLGINFDLMDTSTREDNWSIDIEGEIRGVGIGASGGGTSTGQSPNRSQTYIRLNIQTPEPPPPDVEVTVLSVTGRREKTYYFDNEKQTQLKNEDVIDLQKSFLSIEKNGYLSARAYEALANGEEEITVEGYASATGAEADNINKYAAGRIQSVVTILTNSLGTSAKIRILPAYGSSQAKQKGPIREEKRVVIKYGIRTEG